MRLRSRGIGSLAIFAFLAACGVSAGPARVVPEKKREPRAALATATPRRPPARKAPAARASSALPSTEAARAGRLISPALKEISLDASALAVALAAMPETRELAADFRPFSTEALNRALAAQRAPQATSGLHLARAALLWSPGRGDKVVVLSGDTTQGAILLAYSPQAPGGPRFAGSYQTRGEHAPILLGARSGANEELLFSTCWACSGEGGAIRLDSGGQARLVPR